jgi:hypothetical protein
VSALFSGLLNGGVAVVSRLLAQSGTENASVTSFLNYANFTTLVAAGLLAYHVYRRAGMGQLGEYTLLEDDAASS